MITDYGLSYMRIKDNFLEKPKRKRKKGVKPGEKKKNCKHRFPKGSKERIPKMFIFPLIVSVPYGF